MEEAIKTGWWANRSTTTKFLIIGGALALAGFGIYYFTKKDDDSDSNESKSDTKKDTDSSSSDTTTAESHKSESTVTEKKEIPASSEKEKTTIALPNNGVGCSAVITNFDRDFDYLKCNGMWHIISKPNPATPSTKGVFKEWTSLEGKTVTIERLNRRYATA